MSHLRSTLYVFLASLCLFCVAIPVYAGTQGILEGRVKDKENGEGLVGVNVVIVGTNVGAVTDVEGRFIVNNVEVGTYSVRFSQVGYQQVIYRNVTIRPDLRTNVDVSMVQTSVQMGEVEVTAERPMIEKD